MTNASSAETRRAAAAAAAAAAASLTNSDRTQSDSVSRARAKTDATPPPTASTSSAPVAALAQAVPPLRARRLQAASRAPDAFAVAPMMEVTDHHFRTMARLMTRRALLYTEMVVGTSIVYNPGRAPAWLAFDPAQHPIVLQLGGSDEEIMAQATRAVAAGFPYDAINLNCGCPSDKVAGRGCFGASLMKRPRLVASVCRAIAASAPTGTPITVKCRLGVDELDSYEFLRDFVRTVSREAPGVRHFIVHARKAVLGGLSPEQNRTVPPLIHGRVHRLCAEFPHLCFSINGGIRHLADVLDQLDGDERGGSENARGCSGGGRLHGVMVGRAAYEQPWELLAGVDLAVFGDDAMNDVTRRHVLRAYGAYMDAQRSERGVSAHVLAKPIFHLLWGVPRTKQWRKEIDAALRDKSVVWERKLVDAADRHVEAWHLDTTWLEQRQRRRELADAAERESRQRGREEGEEDGGGAQQAQQQTRERFDGDRGMSSVTEPLEDDAGGAASVRAAVAGGGGDAQRRPC